MVNSVSTNLGCKHQMDLFICRTNRLNKSQFFFKAASTKDNAKPNPIIEILFPKTKKIWHTTDIQIENLN